MTKPAIAGAGEPGKAPGSCPVAPCRAAACAGRGEREPRPADPDEALVLSVFRFIGAAYETGDAACWEAAHDRAEAAWGLLDGAILVARATAMVRLIRAEKADFVLLPPACRWLSADESALMRLVRGARLGDATDAAQHILQAAAGIRLLSRAAGALVGSATGMPDPKPLQSLSATSVIASAA